MLKKILSADEKTALVKTELETFFQNQAQSFENHMKIKSEIKSSEEKVKVKADPEDQFRYNDSEIPSECLTPKKVPENDLNLQVETNSSKSKV